MIQKLLVTEVSINETVLFYCGISYLELDKGSEAVTIFKSIKQKEQKQFVEQVKWYLALSYIKQNDFEKAIPILKELILNKGYYSDKAGEILSEIE